MDHVCEPAGIQSFAREQAARAPAAQRALQGYSICDPQEDTFAAECMSFGPSNQPKTGRACSSRILHGELRLTCQPQFRSPGLTHRQLPPLCRRRRRWGPTFSPVLITANCRLFAGGGAAGAPPW
ncbi:unnamed protein product [Ixodes pacificus]